MIKVQQNPPICRCPARYESELIKKLNDIFDQRNIYHEKLQQVGIKTLDIITDTQDLPKEIYTALFQYQPAFQDNYQNIWFAKMSFLLYKNNNKYLRLGTKDDEQTSILFPHKTSKPHKKIEVYVSHATKEENVKQLLEILSYNLTLSTPIIKEEPTKNTHRRRQRHYVLS